MIDLKKNQNISKIITSLCGVFVSEGGGMKRHAR